MKAMKNKALIHVTNLSVHEEEGEKKIKLVNDKAETEFRTGDQTDGKANKHMKRLDCITSTCKCVKLTVIVNSSGETAGQQTQVTSLEGTKHRRHYK